MPSQFLLEKIRVDVCVTSAKTVAPHYGPFYERALGLYWSVSVVGRLGRHTFGRMRKNAALGRIKHAHYALFVKVVSSAFSWRVQKPAHDLIIKRELRAHGPQRSRIILKKGLRKRVELGYVVVSYGKKDGLRNIREEPKPRPATVGRQFCCFSCGDLDKLALGKGLGEGTGKSLVQKFTFALTPQVGLGNCDFSQVRALC